MFSNKLIKGLKILISIGILSIILGFLFSGADHGKNNHEPDKTNSIHSKDTQSIDKEAMHHMQNNRIWGAIYYNALFFLLISLGALVFLAIQYVSQSGWSAVLHRIPEALSYFLPYGSIILIIILICSGLHLNHLFHWMEEGITNPSSQNYDEIIANKSSFLNFPSFITRSIIYVLIWSVFAYIIRLNSLNQDKLTNGKYKYFNNNIKMSAIFLVIFAITSSTSSWDWIMSLEPHWFSTLFGWYIFSIIFVSAISVITIITIYLDHLKEYTFVNKNHLHDLGKFMFAMSIFWLYLWFSQYLLIWYSNIPEEVTFFINRIENYQTSMIFMFLLCFIIPFFMLMSSNSKKNKVILLISAISIILGHWIEFYILVYPGTVGVFGKIGLLEIGILLGFIGLFTLIVIKRIKRYAIIPANTPFLEESKTYQS